MENSPKFIKLIQGSVHFKTRFLPFIQNNYKTLHHYICIVDNYELYKPYTNLITILDIEELRKDHPWSKDYEFLFNEPDPELYAKNFHSFYRSKNSLLPNCIYRLIFPYLYKNNILKSVYIGNNFFMTDKPKLLEETLNSIPPGEMFSALSNNSSLTPQHSIIYDFFKKELKSQFPNLIIPKEQWNLENYIFGYSFKNKEELKLFYEIYDFIVYLFNTGDPGAKQHFFHKPYGYTRMDDILAYLLRIFEVNFNYTPSHYLKYIDAHTIGTHITTPHDGWYYSTGLLDWNLPPIQENQTDFSIKTYIKTNKESLINYYNHKIGNHNISGINEGNIIITHNNL